MKFRAVLSVCVVLCAALAFGIVGCGQQGNDAGQASSAASAAADEQFLASFQTGLEKRWDIVDNEDTSSEDYDEQKTLTDAVDAELGEVQGYTSATFSDSKLQQAAIEYINCLKDQKDALDYYNSDYDKYYTKWSKAYDRRSQLISDFIADYNLTFPDKYAQDVKNMQASGKSADETDSQQAAVDKICKGMKFKKSGVDTYAATVKNTSGYEFKDFSISINLIDKKGTVVDSTYDSVQNWKKGQKVRFEFYSDKAFKKTSVETSSWEIEDE